MKNEKPLCKGCFYLVDNDEVVKDTFINAEFEFEFMEKSKLFKLKTPSRDNETASHKDLGTRYMNISLRLYGVFCMIVSTMKKINYECIGFHLNQNDLQGHKVFTSSIIFKKPEANMQLTQNQTGLEEAMKKLIICYVFYYCLCAFLV
jgi:hypothetical protein